MGWMTKLLTVALLVISAGCGSSSSSSDDGTPPVGLSANALRVVLPTHTVQPGDSFDCWYTDITTDREIYVNGTTGKQGIGGHHITIYYTVAPAPVDHHPCQDIEMTMWRQIGAAGQEAGNGIVDLPDGIATRVPAGKQIVVQTHYVNATSTPHDVADEITVRLLDRSAVKSFASQYAFVDTNFTIPPQSTTSRTSICKTSKQQDFLLMLGHMHEYGTHYKLERLGDDGNPVDTIFDEDWQPSYAAHPPTKRWPAEQPYTLPVGTTLRQTCTWTNTTQDMMMFPREMCLSYSYYLGDDDFTECDNVQSVQ